MKLRGTTCDTMLREVIPMSSARDVYETAVAILSRSERLRLAALILDELSASAAADLEYSDTWTDQDIAEWAGHSLRYAAEAYPGDDTVV